MKDETKVIRYEKIYADRGIIKQQTIETDGKSAIGIIRPIGVIYG